MGRLILSERDAALAVQIYSKIRETERENIE